MGRVYRTEKEWDVIRKNRKDQHTRLEEIAKSLGFQHVKAMMLKMGLNRPYPDMHYRAAKGERDYTTKFIDLLRNSFPQLNITYFTTGKGEMFKTGDHAPMVSEPAGVYNVKPNTQFVVKDDTMADFFKRGDVLHMKEVAVSEVNAFGEPHVIYFRSGIFVRYVWPGHDSFILKSHNPSKVPDIELKFTDITKVNKVVRAERLFE